MNFREISKELLSVAKEMKMASNFDSKALTLSEEEFKDFSKIFNENGWRLNKEELEYTGKFYSIKLMLDIRRNVTKNEFIIQVDNAVVDVESDDTLYSMLEASMKDYKELGNTYKDLSQFNKDFAKYFFTILKIK